MARRSPSRVLRWSVIIGTIIYCAAAWSLPMLVLPGNPGQDLFTTVSVANCTNSTGTKVIGSTCWDTAFVADSLATVETNFMQGDTFNGTQPTDENSFLTGLDTPWAVNVLGPLDVTITVNRFSADAVGFSNVGGMSIGTTLALNYVPMGTVSAPSLDQLVWTQVLYINYQPGGGSVTPSSPANTLDDATFNGWAGICVPIPTSPDNTTPSMVPNNQGQGGAPYCDPIYPFQGRAGGGAGLFDGPAGYWQTPASFRAISLLSVINTQSDTLTIYNDGIDYGFDLRVPEPATILLLVSALFSFGAHRRIQQHRLHRAAFRPT